MYICYINLYVVPFRLYFYGSPQQGATWVDESMNKALKTAALKAHRMVWARRILLDMRALSEANAKRRM